jgi:lipopolysaccharide cholinephosphotransferase
MLYHDRVHFRACSSFTMKAVIMSIDNTTLRKLQLLQFKILLEVKRICEKHDIQYFLMGGTLLGAVRHRGFIPWDDDIDVGMMRSEYDRFLEICREELSPEFFLQTYETDSTYAYSFAKIRLNGTEYPEPANCDVLHHKGICIDIFSFDKAPNNNLLRKLYRIISMEIDIMCNIKYRYTRPDSPLNLKILRLISRLFSKEQLIRMRDDISKRYNDKNTGFLMNGTFNCYPSHIFDHFLKLEFEGIEFPVPAGYITYLEYAYGDYQKLPPESRRKRHTPYLPNFGKYANKISLDEMLKGEMH